MKTITMLCLLITLSLAGTCPAQTYVWNSTANGNWTSAANWLPATGYPNVAGDVARFTNLVSGTGTTIVSIPLNTVVTCGVIQSIYASNSYSFSGGGTLVLDNAGSFASIEFIRPAAGSFAAYVLQFQAIGMKLAQGLSLSNGAASGAASMSITPTGMVGNVNIVFANASRHCHAGGWSPNYTGTILLTNSFMYTRISTVAGDPAVFMSNATVVIRNGNGLYNAGNMDIGAAIDLGAGSAAGNFNPNGVSRTTRSVIGDVTIAGTTQLANHNPVSSCVGAVAYFRGKLSGSGALNAIAGGTATGNSNVLVGVVAPGTSVGALKLNRATSTAASSFLLGTASDAVELQIEITGAGGVPGTDYDYLEVSNNLWAVDLANIDLVVTNSQSGTQTNWFMFSSAGYVGDFNSKTVNAPSYTMVTTATAIGIAIVPEPLWAGALMLVCLLWRRG